MGYEVDKPFEFFIETSKVAECIKSDIKNIEAPRTDDPIIYYI